VALTAYEKVAAGALFHMNFLNGKYVAAPPLCPVAKEY